MTFGSYTNSPDLNREGFGEAYLAGRGIDAIHVVNRDNRWYQYPETAVALATVAKVTAAYDRTLTYGSSMGGYAALRFPDAVGAQAGIALSPQFSVDPVVSPWESRWQGEVVRTRFAEGPAECDAHRYIFYDPRLDLDARHVAMYARFGRATLIALPYAGHPVGPLLTETGTLQEAIAQIARGSFDADAIRRRIRAGRRTSQHYHFLLARRAADRHPEAALGLLRRAAAIDPESHITSAQGRLLDRLGRHDEAAPLHRASVERTPGNAQAWFALADHLEATGDGTGAAAALASASRGQTPSTRVQARVRRFRLTLRRRGLGALDRAFARLVDRIERSRLRPSIMRALGRTVD